MREIPSLYILCLRSIGPPCSAEDTFAPVVPTTTTTTTATSKNNKNDDGGVEDDTETTAAAAAAPTTTTRKTRLTLKRQRAGALTAELSTEPLSPPEATITAETEPNEPPKQPSSASQLLRSFHQRARRKITTSNDDDDDTDNCHPFARIPLERSACIGPGSARRFQPNEVDLHHPIVACCRRRTIRGSSSSNNNDDTYSLIMDYGSPALDVLQAFIDSLVELGRMDDSRLGVHFFTEYKHNILLSNQYSNSGSLAFDAEPEEKIVTIEVPATELTETEPPTPAKRRKKSGRGRKKAPPAASTTAVVTTTTLVAVKPSKVGALSLYNCTISDDTFDAIQQSNLSHHLCSLDLTGVRGLSDTMLSKVLGSEDDDDDDGGCHNTLRALSLKNCRRITPRSIPLLKRAKYLYFLDVGGAFNLSAQHIVNLVPELRYLRELHASGLGWTDSSLEELMQVRSNWKALSLNFSLRLTQAAVKQSLIHVASTLTSLSLAFCQDHTNNEERAKLTFATTAGGTMVYNPVIDNATLAILGRNLLKVTSLDVRGNHQLSTLTGWYDGRATAPDLQEVAAAAQPLVVLARYSSITAASVEETKRVHPIEAAELVVVLDGGGMGAGITRLYQEEEEMAMEEE